MVEFHKELEDVLILKSSDTHRQVQAVYPHVIVGLQCAIAVLRGSQVYAPGVTAIPSGNCFFLTEITIKKIKHNWFCLL